MRTLILITAALATAVAAPAKSLWISKKNSEAGMFADRLATNIGDILLIRIDEETIVSRSASKSTSSNTNITQGINAFIIPDVIEDNSVMPTIGLTPNETFNGTGSVSDTNTLEAKIAVLVVDVLPNGNLVIEGARKISMSGENQYVVLKGIVRGDDVAPDNSVMSSNVVNATVEVIGDGDIMTAQRKGWLNQLLDTVNIF